MSTFIGLEEQRILLFSYVIFNGRNKIYILIGTMTYAFKVGTYK